MEICSRCEKCRPPVHGSGLCRPCYVREHAREVVCLSCAQPRQVQGQGLCRRCYLAQPHVREAKNRARREKYASDLTYRQRTQSEKSGKLAGTLEARRARDRLKAYGLTSEAFTSLREQQDNKCAICLDALVDGRGPAGLHIDHCHVTGTVRGVLCAACNLGLGKFRDDAEVLARAAAYLTRGRPTTEPSRNC